MSVNALDPSGAPPFDPQEIGWWIESADEEIYGPVSRATLRRFLEEGIVSPNTLVRHCVRPESMPVADQPGMMEGLNVRAGSSSGDRLEEAWPRKWRDQVALAEGSIPCPWHKNPAVLFCASCLAPYCNKCRQKPYRKQYYLCRYCQSSNHNRRFVALIADSTVCYVPALATALALGPGSEGFVSLGQFFGLLLLFVRDSLFWGRGPGKRLMGLRVVQSKDGVSPPTHGQGVLRWLSQMIPIYSLFDAFAPLGDPLRRRYGDRWAKTRVLDTEKKVARTRAKVAYKLRGKGVTPLEEGGLTQSEFARIAE